MFNSETADSNAFQNDSKKIPEVAQKAKDEFDNFSKTLRDNGVNALVFEDTSSPVKPDAVFPNNWVSFHENGTVVLYPMQALNRRHERRTDILEQLRKDFAINRIIDLSSYEKENKFLEGQAALYLITRTKLLMPASRQEPTNHFSSNSAKKWNTLLIIFTHTIKTEKKFITPMS